MKTKPTLTTNSVIAGLLATSWLAHAEPTAAAATPEPIVVQEIKAPPPQTGGDCTIARPEDQPIAIGVAVARLPDAQRPQFPQLKPAAGLTIRLVIVKSDAANAGLKAGDILLSWNGDSLVHPEQLRVLAQSAKAGDKIPLTFLRQGIQQQAQLTVSAPTSPPVVIQSGAQIQQGSVDQGASPPASMIQGHGSAYGPVDKAPPAKR